MCVRHELHGSCLFITSSDSVDVWLRERQDRLAGSLVHITWFLCVERRKKVVLHASTRRGLWSISVRST